MGGNNRLKKLLGNKERVGLGGEGLLRTEGRREEALAMLNAAYEAGIRYYDSAPAYAWSEQYLGLFWAQHPDRKKVTFQASKSAQRSATGASADLLRTLTLMGRDHLGLWQIHDLRNINDIKQIEKKGGALQAFYQARENGTAQGIGVTGHHDPEILLHAVRNWDIDTVLMPVNPVEAVIGGFLDRVIPAARERGLGIIGMKTLGAGGYIAPESGLTSESLVRFALSQDIDLVVVGCLTPDEARFLARIGAGPLPLDEKEQNVMVEAVRPYAGRLAYYRGVI